MIGNDSLFETPAAVAPDNLPGVGLDGGWYVVAPPHLWSAGCRAGLIFAHGAVLPGRTLLIRLNTLSPAATNVTVRSDGYPPVALSLTGGSAGPKTLRVPAPMTAPGRDGRIRFEVDHSASPFALGLSADERRLGICLIDITLSPDLTFPIDLTEPFVAATILAGGWHEPEADGCWSRGGCARIVLPAEVLGGRSTLHFDLVPCPGGAGPAVVVTVLVAGRRLARWDFGAGKPDTTIELTSKNSDPGGLVTVELDIANATSPLAAGFSTDSRELGVMLRKISRRIKP